ncbi:MAG: hypothetical protein AAFQ83_09980 [Bacteroidota bacterium]
MTEPMDYAGTSPLRQLRREVTASIQQLQSLERVLDSVFHQFPENTEQELGISFTEKGSTPPTIYQAEHEEDLFAEIDIQLK